MDGGQTAMNGRLSKLIVLCGLALGLAAQAALAGPNLCIEGARHRSAAESAFRRQHYVKAYRLFRADAARGDGYAEMRLGTLYYMGHGVAQNYATAVRWWNAAAESGNATARCNLGVMYLASFGVKRDDVLALMWFTLAGGQGHHDAIAKRDVVLGWRLTSREIREAQNLAASWPACRHRDASGKDQPRDCTVKPR